MNTSKRDGKQILLSFGFLGVIVKIFRSKSIVFSVAFFSFFQSYSISYANEDGFHLTDSERKSLELNYLLEHMVAMSDQMADLMCRVQQLEQDNEKEKQRSQVLEDQNKSLIKKCATLEGQNQTLLEKCLKLENYCSEHIQKTNCRIDKNQNDIDKINNDSIRFFEISEKQKEKNADFIALSDSYAEQLRAALDELNAYKSTNDEEIRQIKEAIDAIHASLASLQQQITATDQKIDRNWEHHENRCNANHQYIAEIHAHADRIHNHHSAAFEKTKTFINDLSSRTRPYDRIFLE